MCNTKTDCVNYITDCFVHVYFVCYFYDDIQSMLIIGSENHVAVCISACSVTPCHMLTFNDYLHCKHYVVVALCISVCSVTPCHMLTFNDYLHCKHYVVVALCISVCSVTPCHMLTFNYYLHCKHYVVVALKQTRWAYL